MGWIHLLSEKGNAKKMARIKLVKNGREITLTHLDGGWNMQDNKLVLSHNEASEIGIMLTVGIFENDMEAEDG